MDPSEEPLHSVTVSSHAGGRASMGTALFAGHGKEKRIGIIHALGKSMIYKVKYCFAFLLFGGGV